MREIKKLVTNDIVKIKLSNVDTSPTHTHGFLEIAYVKNGKARHILNGKESIIKKGDFLIMDYDAVHSYKNIGKEKLEILNCLFHPEIIDKTLRKCRNFSEVVNNYMIKYNYGTVNVSPANYVYSDDDGEILSLLSKMKEEYEKKISGYYEIMRCSLIEIIIRTMRKSTTAVKTSGNEICDYIMKYVSENLSEKNILGKISGEVNYSTSYLSLKFKEKTGITFLEYLKKARIEESCRLLANTDKKIIEIAYLSGYSDIKFFNRIFKKHLGITPREFRKIHNS